MAEVEPNQPILSENEANEPRSIFEDESFSRHIAKFLHLSHMKQLRNISRAWNSGLAHSRSFQAKCKGRFLDHWHENLANAIPGFWDYLPGALEFSSAELIRFLFRSNNTGFKFFWHHAARTLTSLSIQHSGIECEGFIFLLNNCPALESLCLTYVKLRDLNDYHSPPEAIAVQVPKTGEPDPVPYPITGTLRRLSFQQMHKIESCFMDYLIRRTGGLEYLEITGCFMQDRPFQNYRIPKMPTLQEMFVEFQRKLIQLLFRNHGTLRSLNFKGNQFQEHMLSTLAPLMTGRVIPELSIDLLPDSYQGSTQFLNSPTGIEKLRLRYIGRFTNVELQAALRNLEGSLREFDLIFDGSQLPEPLELDWLSRYTRLEKFKVTDAKKLSYSEMRRIVGGKRVARVGVWRRRRFGWGRRNMAQLNVNILIKKVITNMSPSFMSRLPLSLHNLTIDRYICRTNIFEARPVDEVLALYRRLTRLELRGPWIHTLAGVLAVIVAEMQQLRSLTIFDVGLNDTMVTGLDAEAAGDLARCLTYGLALFTTEAVPTQEAVLQAVEQNLRIPGRTDNYRGLTDLIHLEHLDLSYNVGITGLSLFYGLRIPGLKNLSLSNCTHIDNSGLEFLALFCPNLETLNIKNCRRISKYGMNTYIKRSKKLRQLYTTPFIKHVQHEGLTFTESPDYEHVVRCTPQRAIPYLDIGNAEGEPAAAPMEMEVDEGGPEIAN